MVSLMVLFVDYVREMVPCGLGTVLRDLRAAELDCHQRRSDHDLFAHFKAITFIEIVSGVVEMSCATNVVVAETTCH